MFQSFITWGQAGDNAIEVLAVAQLLKTPEGHDILNGELDAYLTGDIWFGVAGTHNLETDETTLGIPLGLYHKIGNSLFSQLRVEPVYNLKENRFSGLVVVDTSYRF